MAKASTTMLLYGKMYGMTLPTPEKMGNTFLMADIMTKIYMIAQNDAVENKWR